MMKVGPLFSAIHECKKPIIICQGGGDAIKTTSILQKLAIDCTRYRKEVTTVTGVDLPFLKGGALRTFQTYVEPDFSHYIRQYNIAESTYRFHNGHILEFKSFKDEKDARGSERRNLFMNEGQGVIYDMAWQLMRKTRATSFVDYNPTTPFWVHDKLLVPESMSEEYKGLVQLFITDHRHNPFLLPKDHLRYESISDKELFRVYSRGLTGKVTGLIFGHFKRCDAMPFTFDRIIWGLDYGYTNDPTALVKIAIVGRKRYAKECLYESGASAERILEALLSNGFKYDQSIYSEADPNMINQLRLLGLPVEPAIKGPGSPAAGISKVREHECYYTADSENFEKELLIYKFLTAQDLATGRTFTTNIPIKAWDHLCDAFRYADYTDNFRIAS